MYICVNEIVAPHKEGKVFPLQILAISGKIQDQIHTLPNKHNQIPREAHPWKSFFSIQTTLRFESGSSSLEVITSWGCFFCQSSSAVFPARKASIIPWHEIGLISTTDFT